MSKEYIRYKGKGKHSVNDLEKIIEQREEELHLIKSSNQVKNNVVLGDVIKSPTPNEMAESKLEEVRGENLSLWVDGEQTDYWKEIYSMAVRDERDRNGVL